jgi:hypothetical protein
MSKKDILDMLSRDLCLCLLVDWMGQIRESESLEREGWGEGHGYSKVPRW